jgi:hypothetical protein
MCGVDRDPAKREQAASQGRDTATGAALQKPEGLCDASKRCTATTLEPRCVAYNEESGARGGKIMLRSVLVRERGEKVETPMTKPSGASQDLLLFLCSPSHVRPVYCISWLESPGANLLALLVPTVVFKARYQSLRTSR